jgi:hypothetical protein
LPGLLFVVKLEEKMPAKGDVEVTTEFVVRVNGDETVFEEEERELAYRFAKSEARKRNRVVTMAKERVTVETLEVLRVNG